MDNSSPQTVQNQSSPVHRGEWGSSPRRAVGALNIKLFTAPTVAFGDRLREEI